MVVLGPQVFLDGAVLINSGRILVGHVSRLLLLQIAAIARQLLVVKIIQRWHVSLLLYLLIPHSSPLLVGTEKSVLDFFIQRNVICLIQIFLGVSKSHRLIWSVTPLLHRPGLKILGILLRSFLLNQVIAQIGRRLPHCVVEGIRNHLDFICVVVHQEEPGSLKLVIDSWALETPNVEEFDRLTGLNDRLDHLGVLLGRLDSCLDFTLIVSTHCWTLCKLWL